MDSLLVAKGPQTWAANPGSTPGSLPRPCPKSGQAAQNLGVGRFSHNLLFGRLPGSGAGWAGLPKVLPGELPRVSSELPSPGGGKELAVADIISNTVHRSIGSGVQSSPHHCNLSELIACPTNRKHSLGYETSDRVVSDTCDSLQLMAFGYVTSQSPRVVSTVS